MGRLGVRLRAYAHLILGIRKLLYTPEIIKVLGRVWGYDLLDFGHTQI